MYSIAIHIGGFVRWLLKGCKTNIRDEIDGNLDPKWFGSYDFENYIIGLISVSVFTIIVIYIFF